MDWKHFIEDFLMKIEKSNEAERARLIQSITEILQEKEQIQAERDRYHSYLENASDTIAEMDAQGRIIYTTHNWMRQLGHTPDEVKGYSIFGHLFHPEDAPRAQEFLKKAIDTKKTQTGFEYRIRNKDGEYRWHTANLSPVINDDQEVKTVIAIAHSVHERKLAELRLHERETRYRLLLNTMREAVIMVDNNDVVKYVNPRCCELFGLSEEDILGKKGYECLIIPEDQNIILQKNVQRTKGLIDDYTVRGRKKDGSLIWLRISGAPMRNEENEVIGSVGIMTDITESKLAMEALMRSEEKYRNLFENAMAGVFQSTLDDRYLSVNNRFAEMVGYSSPQELIDSVRDIKDIYEDPAARESLKEQLLTNGIVENYEVCLKRKDGSTFWISLSARLFSLNGQTIIEGAAIDISESKSLREQVVASQKLEAVGKLAGGIAHDFNNLLTIILGYSEDILEDLPPNSPLREPAEEIVKAGLRAAKMTRQLLAFSKKQVIHGMELDLNSQINNLKGIIVRLVGENVSLQLSLAGDLLPVKADPGQIEQILINLVLNSKEAMPQGGKIRIDTRNEIIEADSPLLKFDLKPDRYVLLTVSDTGEGIPENIINRVFEPFFTTKEDARGLGLSIVWGIVKQMGGHITLNDVEPHGASVNVYLPVCNPSGKLDKLRLQTPEMGKNQSIMIVEDEEPLCILIQKMLTNLGYKVSSFTNPLDALNAFRKGASPDLLLTDVIMPQMTGKQLIDEVKRINQKQKILVMSGFSDDVIAKHGILLDDIILIQKPFTASQIAPMIRDILFGSQKDFRIMAVAVDEGFCSLMLRSCKKRGFICNAFTDFSLVAGELKTGAYDAIVADLGAKPDQCISELRKLRLVAPDIPLVLISDSISETDLASLDELSALKVIEKQTDHNLLADYIYQLLLFK